MLSLPSGVAEGTRLVCELTQPSQPPSRLGASGEGGSGEGGGGRSEEFDCWVPVHAQPGDRLCVHSPDGAQVLLVTVPSALPPSRMVRVRLG